MTNEQKTNIEALKALISFVVATESEVRNADINGDGKISMAESIQLAMNVALISPNFLRKLRQIPIEAMDLDKNEEAILAQYVADLTGEQEGNEILLLIILSTIKNLRLFSLIRSKKGKIPASLIAAKVVEMPFRVRQIDENTFDIISETHERIHDYFDENNRFVIVLRKSDKVVDMAQPIATNSDKKAYAARKAREYRVRKKAKKIQAAAAA